MSVHFILARALSLLSLMGGALPATVARGARLAGGVARAGVDTPLQRDVVPADLGTVTWRVMHGSPSLKRDSASSATSGDRQQENSTTTSGSVWAWGDNRYGELGNGSTRACSTMPVQVRGLAHVVAIATGLALRSDGTVWAWGYNQYSQLGDCTTTDSPTPVRVRGLTHVVAIATGGGYSLALVPSGSKVLLNAQMPLNAQVPSHIRFGGGPLHVHIETAPGARVVVMLTVQSISGMVRYRVIVRGTADAHGLFIAELRNHYVPSRPTQALLTVTVHSASRKASLTVRITLVP